MADKMVMPNPLAQVGASRDIDTVPPVMPDQQDQAQLDRDIDASPQAPEPQKGAEPEDRAKKDQAPQSIQQGHTQDDDFTEFTKPR